MRKLSALVLAVAAAFTASAQAEKSTADYYYIKNFAGIGASATLYVSAAKPLAIYCDNNVVCFECKTVGPDGSDGGKIRVLMPQWRAAAFREKYARPATPKPLSGTIKKYQWSDGISTIVLFIESDTAEK